MGKKNKKKEANAPAEVSRNVDILGDRRIC